MSTQIQENVAKSNEQYAASFKSGHLALPPAKKYLVGMCQTLPNHSTPSNIAVSSDLYGRPHRSSSSIRHRTR
jgi:hypothetical protein